MKTLILILTFAFLTSGFKDLKGHPEYSILLENEKNNISIYQASVSSVVNITIEKTVKVGNSWFYGPSEEKSLELGAGSGFVWDNKGHIVTNSHVVHQGDTFWVSFFKNKKKYKAKVIGKYLQKDLAVLKLENSPKNLTPIKVGSSKDLMVGQKAIAIGNPLGLSHTMTVGVISALDRKIPGFGDVEIHGVIQTDAAINQGNSGGPLLDSQGRLIGVNTMIFSTSGSSAGLGFAVPVDTVNRIIPDLIRNGRITRAGLGVGIAANPYGEDGLVITYISKGSGADKAGLRGITRDEWGRTYVGDIILEVDGKKLKSYNDIFQSLENKKIGDRVKVKILRADKIENLTVELSPLEQ